MTDRLGEKLGAGEAGWIEATTLGDLVRRASQTWTHDALVLPDERVTYPELGERVHAAARRLVGLGIERGDMVGILVPTSVEYVVLMHAIATVGAVAVPVNARFKARELRHVVTNAGLTALFTSADAPDMAGVHDLLVEALPGLTDATSTRLDLAEAPALRHVVALDEAPPSYAIDRATFEAADADVDEAELERRRYVISVSDPALVIYTSGTTSNPKGALISHEALVRRAATVAHTRYHMDHTDRMWTPLPQFHIGGISFGITCLTVGATYVHAGRFDPTIAVHQLADERCTVAIPAFETIWLLVLDHPDLPTVDLSPLRVVFNIGVPARLEQMQERLPDAIQVSGYGSTEGSSFVTIGETTDALETRVGTCGFPLVDGELRIADPETGETLPPNTVGEIRFRGPCTFSGYLPDPENPVEPFDDDGWFRSGDLGTLDDDGRLRFVSRLKDMLKVGGENVAAAEIEGHLVRHPAVQMAQVVAAPDAYYTEVAAAFVQLKPGAAATEQELIDHCLGQIATFKVPRYVRFVDDYPMSGTKIRKFVLRDRIAAELAEKGITRAPKMSSRD